jgi:adenosylcobinamide-GDP ribazoletransferase
VSPTRAAERARTAGRAAAAAVALLTRVPLPRRLALGAGDAARGAACFPLVGAAIGLLAGAAAAATAAATPSPLLAGAAGALAAILATGALHLDGLADAADALGGRTREDALRIMRDHAIGAYGAVALVVDLLLRAAALGALAGADAVAAIVAATVAGALSRAAGAIRATRPYARTEATTLAGAFTRSTHRGPAAVALLLAAVAVAATGMTGVVQALAAGAVAAAVLRTAHRRVGGVTGDVLGAAIETSETAALVAAALVL